MTVVEDARAEFERQARELVAAVKDYPEPMRRAAIEAEMRRFSQARYDLTRGATVDILRAAL